MKKCLYVLLVILLLLKPVSVYAADNNEVFYANSGIILCSYNMYNPPILYDHYFNFHNSSKVSVYVEDAKLLFIITPEPTTFHNTRLQNGYDPAKQPMSKNETSASPMYTYNGVNYQFPFVLNLYVVQMANVDLVSHSFDKIYSSMNDFCEDLKKYNDLQNFVNKNDYSSGGGDKLPLLDFKIKQSLTMGQGLTDKASVKYTFSWSVSQHDIYANNPNRYVLQMLATAKYTQKDVSGTSTVVAEDVGYINPECNTYISRGIPIYKESYSFLERTYREELCEIAGVDKSASSVPLSYYFTFVRVVESDTGKTSMWKVYRCQGRNISPSGYYYDDEGKQYAGNTEDDIIDDSTNFDSDSSTDDYSDPNSPSYNNGAEMDAEHLLNNLEEIIFTLKGIPELFEKVFLWMPDYLIVLIATSIGLLLVVGFVKLFLR